MESVFGDTYKGDPGIPHSGTEPFENIWLGAIGFSAVAWFHPYMSQLTTQFNWHDKAMLYEQHHWKKAREKGVPYDPLWNKMDKAIRDSYYRNWPVFFK